MYYNKKKSENSQQRYLNKFDTSKNGPLQEQNMAKSNMTKFHPSIMYTVSQCTVCHDAWPLKSKPRSSETYECSRCLRG